MKIPYSILIFLSSCMGFGTTKEAPKGNVSSSDEKPSIYNIEVTTLEGDTISLSKFKGKKILFVNTASKCGFTPQYQELQDLHEKFGDQLVVIGVPSNDFGQQEPGNSEDIKEFCQRNFGVSFLMLEKTVVKGEGKDDLYSWLTNPKENGWNEQEPTWNFCKYVIDENGKLTNYFGSSVKPNSNQFLKESGLK